MSISLSASALRSIGFIRAGVARGLSTSVIQNTLSEAGMGVRRTDLLAAVRSVRGQEAAAGRLRFVRADLRPDPGRFAPAIHKTLRKFSVVMELRDALGDRRFLTIASNEPLSRARLEDEALGAWSDGLVEDPERYGGFEPEEALPYSAWRAGPEGSFL